MPQLPRLIITIHVRIGLGRFGKKLTLLGRKKEKEEEKKLTLQGRMAPSP
jgi:hypothetical protein